MRLTLPRLLFVNSLPYQRYYFGLSEGRQLLTQGVNFDNQHDISCNALLCPLSKIWQIRYYLSLRKNIPNVASILPSCPVIYFASLLSNILLPSCPVFSHPSVYLISILPHFVQYSPVLSQICHHLVHSFVVLLSSLYRCVHCSAFLLSVASNAAAVLRPAILTMFLST